MRAPGFRTLLPVVVLAGIAGCSGPLGTSGPYAGLSRTYEPGTPAFDAQTRPSNEGGARGIRVDVSTPELTLVFRRSGTDLAARIEWLVRLMRADDRQLIEERTYRDTVVREGISVPSLFTRAAFSTFFEAAPDRYLVEVVLEDLSSGKTERKELIFELPARNQPLLATDLRLESADGRPIVELLVPESDARRKVSLYVTGNVQRPALLRYSLFRLETDSSAAQSPYWQGPGSGFAGLNPPPLFAADTLAVERRVVERGPLARIEFAVPPVDQGTYRVEVAIEDLETEGDPPAIELSRYIIVRRSNFPLVEGYGELIPPLIYLADASEWETLANAAAEADAREHFDAFWGRRMQDREVAARVVHSYFSRVEEANLRYSAFKEGWKTDRGMVFMILGEPLFIERTIEAEIWHYSYEGDRGERSFVFNRVWREETPEVIDEYLLERSFEYERFWREEVSRWRTGAIS